MLAIEANFAIPDLRIPEEVDANYKKMKAVQQNYPDYKPEAASM